MSNVKRYNRNDKNNNWGLELNSGWDLGFPDNWDLGLSDDWDLGLSDDWGIERRANAEKLQRTESEPREKVPRTNIKGQ